LTNNYCLNNSVGIYLLSSDFNVLSWNLLYNNGFGINLTSDSDNNLIHHNNFINNSNSPQANDDGINNQWYDSETKEGNFWSDYSGSGDYLITGSAGSVDPYPTKILPFIDLDGDFMDDYYENEMGLDPTNSSDAKEDLDNDGLTNLYEFQNGLLANNPDTDGDGMSDGWEVAMGLNATFDDAAGDFDTDGLSNLYEYQHDLLANNSDSDGDLMSDGWEVAMGFNPLLDDANEDADGDGLTNLYEFEHNLNASNSDTDSDGMPDGWEVENGLNPLIDDAEEDKDNDGKSNLKEYLEGTNPNDSKWAVFKAKTLPILKIILLILSVIILIPLSVVITKLLFLYKECLPIKIVILNYLNFVIDSSEKIAILQNVYLTLNTHPDKVHRSVVLDNELIRIKKDLEDYELVEYINNLIDQHNNFILKKAILTLDEAFLSLSGKIAQLENEMKNNLF
jgi:parallel beta-helix repeat protein